TKKALRRRNRFAAKKNQITGDAFQLIKF
ncbi:MAG: hypothetical protein RL131_440, partial [Bacteroidota bacterium]